MKRLLFVYNPNAGKGGITAKVGEILDIFVKAGYLPIVYPTQAAKDGYRIIQNYKDKYDLIVCSGGDGTLDEVVSGMMERNDKIPIGYIPTGSTNDFAKSLDISKNPIDAAEIAVTGKKFSCDVGTFNGDPFIYIAAFGMFTEVSYATSQDVKNVLGHMAYILEGMKRLHNITSYSMKITHDDIVLEGKFLFGMVTNSRSVGGFTSIVGKSVIFDDGVFEVTLIKKPKNFIELQEIIASILIENINTKYMYTFKARKLVFESSESVPWTLDGEFGGEHEIAVIENHMQAIDIVISQNSFDEMHQDKLALELKQ